jgi:hypothetical protein
MVKALSKILRLLDDLQSYEVISFIPCLKMWQYLKVDINL